MLLALDLDYFRRLCEPWRELERVIIVARAIRGARELPGEPARSSDPRLWVPARGERGSKLD